MKNNEATTTTRDYNKNFRIPTPKVQTLSISQQVIKLSQEGKNKGEIQKIMADRLGRPIRYQHIFNILQNEELKKLRPAKEEETN